MKSWAANIVLLFLVFFSSSCNKRIMISRATTDNSQARLFVDEHQNVSQPIIEIMRITGLEAKTKLHDVVWLTQKSWLRPRGLEHIHLAEKLSFVADNLLKYFDLLGLVKSIKPRRKTYDYVLLLGSMYETFKTRLHFLEQLTSSGLRFKAVALLGSHRPLERQHEIEPMMAENSFSVVPLTEIEMMEALFGQSTLKSLDQKSILPIASPMKIIDDKHIVRANTLDTVEDFLRLKKKPGSVLVISSQPHVLRQHLVVSKALNDQWQIETVGESSSKSLPTAVYLDEAARTLFELDQGYMARK